MKYMLDNLLKDIFNPLIAPCSCGKRLHYTTHAIAAGFITPPASLPHKVKLKFATLITDLLPPSLYNTCIHNSPLQLR
jgi:hypothetical protein